MNVLTCAWVYLLGELVLELVVCGANSVIQIGFLHLLMIAVISLMNNVLFTPLYQCTQIKSTLGLADMNCCNQLPVVKGFPAVAGLPIRVDLFTSVGQFSNALLTVILDCEALSGSLYPSKVVVEVSRGMVFKEKHMGVNILGVDIPVVGPQL